MKPKGQLLVAMLQETGHLNPSFKLMRALAQRGYQVRYLASPALAEQVRAQGFEVAPFFPELFRSAAPAGPLRVLMERRTITSRYRSLNERLLQEGAHAFGARPALALVDVTQTPLALWARLFRIPLLLLNTSLPQTKDPGVAPLRSALPYEDGAWGRLRSELAWRRFLLERRAGARLADLAQMCPPYELARRLAPRFGVAASELDAETVYMPQLRDVPELVFCPREFDFPRPTLSTRHYVESLDSARQEQPDFPWQALHPERPLVYCALGGQLYRARETPKFLKRVVAAFAQRPTLQLVLASGKHVKPEALAPHPPNVVVVERAPQLALLARARAMITHAGLGSVKECIAHAVPMLAFPLAVDQPGNAARVAHHGLGLVGDVKTTGVAELLHLIDRVLADEGFRARSKALQAKLRALETAQPGAALVESMLKQKLVPLRAN
jgi:zeaxanthin glucosyltransferase